LGWRNHVHHFFAVIPVAQLRIDASYPSPFVVRVAVAGEIDLATVDVLHDGLRPVLSAPLPHLIEVDLAGVTFMDCIGLGVLVAVRYAAVGAGRQLRVTNPQPIVRRILELSGLLGVLTAAFDQALLAPPGPASGSPIGATPAAVPRPAALLVAA
jgi:anti-anti-sigma factor